MRDRIGAATAARGSYLPAHGIADVDIVHRFAGLQRNVADVKRRADDARQGTPEHEHHASGFAACGHLTVPGPLVSIAYAALFLPRQPDLVTTEQTVSAGVAPPKLPVPARMTLAPA